VTSYVLARSPVLPRRSGGERRDGDKAEKLLHGFSFLFGSIPSFCLSYFFNVPLIQ
jgi:hypothetical protein